MRQMKSEKVYNKFLLQTEFITGMVIFFGKNITVYKFSKILVLNYGYFCHQFGTIYKYQHKILHKIAFQSVHNQILDFDAWVF